VIGLVIATVDKYREEPEDEGATLTPTKVWLEAKGSISAPPELVEFRSSEHTKRELLAKRGALYEPSPREVAQ